MQYDFTSIIDRTGYNTIAVDEIPIPDAQVDEGFSPPCRYPCGSYLDGRKTFPETEFHSYERGTALQPGSGSV